MAGSANKAQSLASIIQVASLPGYAQIFLRRRETELRYFHHFVNDSDVEGRVVQTLPSFNIFALSQRIHTQYIHPAVFGA